MNGKRPQESETGTEAEELTGEEIEKIGLLRLTEKVLRRDWDSEEDEFWDDYS